MSMHAATFSLKNLILDLYSSLAAMSFPSPTDDRTRVQLSSKEKGQNLAGIARYPRDDLNTAARQDTEQIIRKTAAKSGYQLPGPSIEKLSPCRSNPRRKYLFVRLLFVLQCHIKQVPEHNQNVEKSCFRIPGWLFS
jgi:hypothetical protein